MRNLPQEGSVFLIDDGVCAAPCLSRALLLGRTRTLSVRSKRRCHRRRTVEGDKRRAAGFHGNAAMPIDPHLKNTCLAHFTGGSAGFYDTSVKLEPASESDAAGRSPRRGEAGTRTLPAERRRTGQEERSRAHGARSRRAPGRRERAGSSRRRSRAPDEGARADRARRWRSPLGDGRDPSIRKHVSTTSRGSSAHPSPTAERCRRPSALACDPPSEWH
jgi:hypothetical protein